MAGHGRVGARASKATDGGESTGKEMSDDERLADESLPQYITYEAFVDFTRNDVQRATLMEELKERGCCDLCNLLCLWWDACQLERGVERTRLWNQYSQTTAKQLRDNI